MPAPTSDYSFFWPGCILILGLAFSVGNQVSLQESQRAELLLANDQIGPKVKQAEYEQNKLHALAVEILRQAKTDPNAAQLVTEFKIKEIPNSAKSR